MTVMLYQSNVSVDNINRVGGLMARAMRLNRIGVGSNPARPAMSYNYMLECSYVYISIYVPNTTNQCTYYE